MLISSLRGQLSDVPGPLGVEIDRLCVCDAFFWVAL
jgi:hypothetical protein